MARASSQCCKGAADESLSVGLHRDGVDIEIRIRDEPGVDRGVGIEAREPAVRFAAYREEVAGDENLAVRLYRQRVDLAVGRGAEARVHRPAGMETREAGTRKPAN